MGRVVLTIPAQIIPKPVMPVFFAKSNFTAQVMLVSPGTVDNFAEQPLFHHVKSHHLPPAKAAILQEHERRTGLFITFYQIIASLEAIASAHLNGYCFARIHSSQGNLHMALPCGSHNNGIDLFVPYHIKVV